MHKASEKSPLNCQVYVNDTSGPWLLLLHGLFGDGDNLAVVKRHFESKYNILSIDLPHHGRSSHQFSFSLNEWADAIATELMTRGIFELSVVGHSLGGKVAMMLARNARINIHHLVIVDIAPVSYSHRHQSVFAALKKVKLTTLKSRQEADYYLALELSDASTRQFLLKSLVKSTQGHFSWRFNLNGLVEAYSQLSYWTEASSPYTGSTVFIKGALSDYIVQEYQEAIKRQFPLAKAHVIANTGHWLHAEKPQSFLRVLDNIL